MLNFKLRILCMVLLTFLLFLYWDVKPKIFKCHDLKILAKELRNELHKKSNSSQSLFKRDARSAEEILEQYIDKLMQHGFQIVEISDLTSTPKANFLETTFQLTFSGDFVHLDALWKDFFAGSLPVDLGEFSITLDERGIITMMVHCVVLHIKRDS